MNSDSSWQYFNVVIGSKTENKVELSYNIHFILHIGLFTDSENAKRTIWRIS